MSPLFLLRLLGRIRQCQRWHQTSCLRLWGREEFTTRPIQPRPLPFLHCLTFSKSPQDAVNKVRRRRALEQWCRHRKVSSRLGVTEKVGSLTSADANWGPMSCRVGLAHIHQDAKFRSLSSSSHLCDGRSHLR